MSQQCFTHLNDIHDDIVALYETGLPPGAKTGWPSLDKHYTVAMHQWTLVTGIPHSGKSEWLDALMVNLTKDYRWRFVIFSPENQPLQLHASKIMEKFVGKPFGAGPTERMTPDEREQAFTWMKDKFAFCQFKEPTLDAILAEASRLSSVESYCKTGVVIDPWNTIEHRRPKDLTTTEYVSQQLSEIIHFSRNHDAHVWLVAHPTKPNATRGKNAPTPYEISDSAHFYNKADCIVTVHRNQLEESQKVEIHVQKCRFKHIGHIGMIELMYDRTTGRYFEPRPAHGVSNYYRGAA